MSKRYEDEIRKNLPVNWQIVALGDIYRDLSAGSTPSRSKPEYFQGNILWVSSGELNYNVIFDTQEKITPEALKNTNLKLHPKGTFLIAITGLEAAGTRGRCALLGEKATTNQSCMAFYETDQVKTEYLFQWYKRYGNKLAFNYAQGTKQQSFNNRIVASIPISLPPLPEQQKIAEILSTVDAKIDNIDQQIKETEQLKKGMMQRLLTQGIGHTDFKDSPLGRIPKSWELKKVNEIADVITGAKDTQNKVDDGEYPFYVRSQTIERINSYSFDGEAVLTSGDGVGVGKIYHYVNGKFDFHQRVYNIHNFDSQILGMYFYFYFSNHFYGRVMRLSAKNSVDSVRRSMITDMLIPVPEISEQKSLVDILHHIDRKADMLRKKKDKFGELKRGLLQKLLTGQIRVHVNSKELHAQTQ